MAENAENQPRRRGRRPGAAEHLKKYQWKKGQSGNPGGCPKGSISLVRMLRQHLSDNPERAHAILENLLDQGARGDEKALGFIREIIDRIDGKAPQTIQGPGGEPVSVVLQWGEPTAETEDE